MVWGGHFIGIWLHRVTFQSMSEWIQSLYNVEGKIKVRGVFPRRLQFQQGVESKVCRKKRKINVSAPVGWNDTRPRYAFLVHLSKPLIFSPRSEIPMRDFQSVLFNSMIERPARSETILGHSNSDGVVEIEGSWSHKLCKQKQKGPHWCVSEIYQANVRDPLKKYNKIRLVHTSIYLSACHHWPKSALIFGTGEEKF